MLNMMYVRLKSQLMLFVMWASAMMLALRNGMLLRQLWADARGDGSMNFLITVVISVAIAAILIGIITAAMPDFWTTIQGRIETLLGN